MVSMKDIARECKVSVATVSKALNDQSDISPATKQLVKDTAKDMGYFPNSSARTLKTNRSNNIGVLFSDRGKCGLTNEYFASLLETLKANAEDLGYDVTFISKNVHGMSMTYYEHCRYRNVDGVIIACIDYEDDQVKELVLSDIPVIVLDHIYDNRISIISDNVGGMHDLMEYIISLGHTKIAYIHGDDASVTRNRLTSFNKTLYDNGIETPNEYICSGVYHNADIAYKYTLELLALREPPTCIVYPDDFSVIGGINAIKSLGLVPGKDVSLAGYDGISLGSIITPSLTTIKQDTTTIGRLAALRLADLIENPSTTLIEHIKVAGELIKGDSVVQIK